MNTELSASCVMAQCWWLHVKRGTGWRICSSSPEHTYPPHSTPPHTPHSTLHTPLLTSHHPTSHTHTHPFSLHITPTHPTPHTPHTCLCVCVYAQQSAHQSLHLQPAWRGLLCRASQWGGKEPDPGGAGHRDVLRCSAVWAHRTCYLLQGEG